MRTALLTEREEQVIGLLAEGRTNAEIAEELGVTFPTAKTHVSNILSKLGVESREEAVQVWRGLRQRPAPRRWLGVPLAAQAAWRPIAVAAGLLAAAGVAVVFVTALASRDDGAPAGATPEPTETVFAGPTPLVGPHLIEETTGIWQRTLMSPATVDSRGGLYIWNPRAGTVERWNLPTDSVGGYSISADGRWITGATPLGDLASLHLVDRRTGRSWSWPDDPLILMEAEGDHVSIRTRNLFDWGTLYTFDSSMQLLEVTPAPPNPGFLEGDLSPDGSLLARIDSLTEGDADGGLTMGMRWAAVVVADASTGMDLFRVRGNLGHELFIAQTQWLGDSSGIVVTIRAFPEQGLDSPRYGYVLVSRDGQRITEFPFESGVPAAEVAPSPIDRDVFAINRSRYLNIRTGEEYRLNIDVSKSPFPATWSSDGSEIRWVIAEGGRGGGRPIMLASVLVDFPPFPEELRFRVARAETCLNVRELPEVAAAVLTCVPDGALLTLAPGPLPDWPVPVSVAPTGLDWSFWTRVRMADGTEGWVSADYLDWAE